MKRYDSYKDSGVKWLGEIPSHWEMKRWRFLMNENVTKNNNCNVRLQLQFKYGDIVRKSNQSEEKDVLEIISKYTVVEPDDIMINGLNLNYDFISQRVARVREEGAITSAYVSLRPTEIADSRFYTYFLKSMDAKKMFHGMGTGIRLTLSYNELKNQFLPKPSLKEQEAISNYLDSATSKIDEAIAQQQKMIDLLNERKQIIIDNAITKGVIPNVKTYFTNVDIIGDIPEHWNLIKMKRIAKGFSNGTSLVQIPNGETNYKVSRIETISSGVVNYEKVGYVRYDKSLDRYKMRKNDILISNINSFERIGNSAIYDGEEELYHGMNLLRITPHDINPNFLFLFLRSSFFSSQMKSACKPAINQVSVPSSNVKNMLCPLPPSREQYEIVEFCNKHIGVLDKEIESVMLQISLLQERKQIIINDVVTGKVKVV